MITLSARSLITGALTIVLGTPIGVTLAASPAPVNPPGSQTRKDLEQSMRGEAFANASYRLYAAQAQREKLPAVARLFERIADVELGEHFREAAELSGLVHGDAENLRAALAGEIYESRRMYPDFARQAKAAGDSGAAALFAEIARDEGRHARAFGTALRVVESGRGEVPEPPQADAVQVPQGPPEVRSKQTMTNLDTAMHGEALAYANYQQYAEHAKDPAVAKLFRGTSDVELHEHFAGEAKLAGLVGSTRANLTKAIAGERYESRTMYPAFAKRAEAAGDIQAAEYFSDTAEDEAGHARAFLKALERLSKRSSEAGTSERT
ncbi:ferritin family protein [Spongiactinospora sp. TRM90649]|uniref:ferritin family protein n=1 Tax=Spongiactinospora sp. TRM90649 TaxID=3031114 RepID=UPI0023F66D05|nr:ferritin family protein [Spongiactinospora sp. TRM90649]MDF5756375.1 ferritin family protein [Spongiactinospora sp. TRM90649]